MKNRIQKDRIKNLNNLVKELKMKQLKFIKLMEESIENLR